MKLVNLVASLTSSPILAIAALNPTGALAASPRLIDLGTLPGGNFSYAYGINSSGHVVGYSNYGNSNSTHAFIWENNSMTDLGTLGGSSSQATAINDKDRVVGESTDSSENSHAFIWQ